MDVANKYVKMVRYSNDNSQEKEKLIVETILRQSNHLITSNNASKHALNECFLEETNKNGKTPLNPIFLKNQ